MMDSSMTVAFDQIKELRTKLMTWMPKGNVLLNCTSRRYSAVLNSTTGSQEFVDSTKRRTTQLIYHEERHG